MTEQYARLAVLIEPQVGSNLNASLLEDSAITAARDLRGTARVGILSEQDGFASAAGRKLRPLSAFIEFTASGAGAHSMLIKAAATAVGLLSTIIDRDRSTLAMGQLHIIGKRHVGKALFAVAGRSADGVSEAEFFHWWVAQHAALVQRLWNPMTYGYEQVHISRTLSRSACADAGLTWLPLTFYETLIADQPATFTEVFGDADKQVALLADEAGRVAHPSMWGATMDEVINTGASVSTWRSVRVNKSVTT